MTTNTRYEAEISDWLHEAAETPWDLQERAYQAEKDYKAGKRHAAILLIQHHVLGLLDAKQLTKQANASAIRTLNRMIDGFSEWLLFLHGFSAQ